MTEKFISWNVNGLRACMSKGFKNFFDETDADIFALQETKLQEGQIDFAPEGTWASGIMPKKRLFRNGRLHKKRTAFRCLRHGCG